MGVIDNLLSRFGYVKLQMDRPGVLRAMAEEGRYAPDASSHEKQYGLYEKLTWISNAIDFTANMAASSAVLSVKREKGEDSEDIPNHPFEVKLKRPNPMQSQFEFWRDYFSYRRLTGNAYVYLNRRNEGAEIDEMWIIPSHLIRPVPDGNSYIRGYAFRAGGATIPLEPWQVMHDKSFNPANPFVGLSAIESLAIVSTGDIAQQAYNTKLFDEDNAKIPGAFAFADNVNDTDWTRLQAEAKAKWGGMKRSGPMWLRGVGAGGVQWMQMALSQKEMEFIEQREFTRDEVYGKLAPGLASVLDVNATEANAMAGKAILSEFCIWPMLVQTSQKITADVMPAYGEGLFCEFDDIRKTDRLIDLQEQELYAKFHTVNEVRSEYYGDDEIEGGDVPVDEWTGAQPEPQPDGTENDPNNSLDAMPDIETGEAVETELKAWERFALKRLGKHSGREFEPRAVPLMQAAQIKAALKRAGTEAEVRTIFSRYVAADDTTLAEMRRSNDLLERAIEIAEKGQ